VTELPTTEPLWEASNKNEPFRDLAVTPDGRFVVSNADKGEIEFRDIETGEVEKSLPGVGKNTTGFACTSDGRSLLAGYSDGRLILWDIEKTSKRFEIKRRKKAASAIRIFPGDEYAATTHVDGSIHLWDITKEKHLNATDVSDGEHSGTGISISNTGENIIIPLEGGELVFFELVMKTELPHLRANDNPQQIAYKFAARCAEILPDGVRFVFGQKNGVVRVGRFDFEEKPRPIILSVCQEEVVSLAVHPIFPQIAIGGLEGTLERWELPHEVCISHYTPHEGRVVKTVFSSDGAYLVAGGEDRLLRCYGGTSKKYKEPSD